MGFDVHRLVEGRELWLGGIRIDHTLGLLGHSDADVLIHALCDALLGAAAMRDIGFHFPDTAVAYKNIDSKILLRDTVALIRERGYEIGNVDVTVCAERPKLNPHIPLMQETLARVMEIDPDKHVPPLLTLQWASLQFTGHLVSCKQEFVRFGEQGIPLRAWMDCVFQEFIAPKKATLPRPLESPDTTKYRTVYQGDALWALSAKEYGQPEQWRAIADANGLANPRLLRSGQRLVLPAIQKGRSR